MERAEGSLKQWLPNGKLRLLSLTTSHGVPCSLPSRMTTKVLKNCKTFSSRPRPRPRLNVQDQDQDQDFMIQDQDTFIFVLEAPRDQDPGLDDYITASTRVVMFYLTFNLFVCRDYAVSCRERVVSCMAVRL